LGEEEIVQRNTGIERWESIVKAKIHVTLKPGILDPQGKAIEHALETLGFNSASHVRVGKYMELELQESAKDKAEAQVKAMCEKLLANTIIEEYRYELQ
jgi:phosphoribosylformylglycinamidine synthase subunit PurS